MPLPSKKLGHLWVASSEQGSYLRGFLFIPGGRRMTGRKRVLLVKGVRNKSKTDPGGPDFIIYNMTEGTPKLMPKPKEN